MFCLLNIPKCRRKNYVTKIMHKFLWWGRNGRGQVGQRAEEADARPMECEVLA
jgi:predicted phosphoadenosine phosphosulfate sulfurtransferase